MRLRRSRMGWVCATVAPWVLATGVLVSFTASAGQDPNATISETPVGVGAASAGGPLVPGGAGAPAILIGLPGLDLGGLVRQASLSFEAPRPMPLPVPDLPLKSDLKSSRSDFPKVDRSRKGDPLVPLRPSLGRRALEVGLAPRQGSFDLVFSQDERALPQTIFMPGSTEIPAPEAMSSFEPVSPEDLTLTEEASAPRSPEAEDVHGTLTPPTTSGTTPAVPRAAVLASTTPAPADAVPMEIAAAPVSAPRDGLSAFGKSDTRPNYAELVDPDNEAREERCLAEAVYFEARSEPDEGQAAVAQVVLNRVRSGLYPSTICGVVFQNRNRYKACQFSFACEGRSLRITEPESWQRAVRVAQEVLHGKVYVAEVGGATHYHADYVRPYWAKRLKKMDVIGRHIFYKLRPGQT